MNKKINLSILSLFSLILVVTTLINPVIAVTVATDTTNDITTVTWINSYQWSAKYGQSVPKIDIQSIEWSATAEGNHTITLNLLGTPVLNNETFYWIDIEGSDEDLVILAWAGGFTGYIEGDKPAYLSVTKGENIVYVDTLTTDEGSVVISGNSITFNVPKEVPIFNFTTMKWENVDLGLPDTPPSSWEWHAMSWTGNTTYGSYSGTWSFDYYPNEDDTYNTAQSSEEVDTTTTSTNDTDQSIGDNVPTGTPGFEFVTLSIGLLVTVVVISKRKKR